MTDFHFNADTILTNLVKQELQITNFSELVNYVQQLPYGRNSNRTDFSLVLKEKKGTCSSKHAFLKAVAQENNLDQVQLILAMYKMNKVNTPKIGTTLNETSLSYIPEAHCYLKINDKRLDITTIASEINTLKNDILLEKEIQANQVVSYKVQFHQEYLKQWLKQQGLDYTFDELWQLREQCIKAIESSN